MTQLQKNSIKIFAKRKHARVAFIFNHSYFLGGGEISFFELIRKLDTKFFKPIAIVPDKGEIERKLSRYKINFYINRFPTIKHIYNIAPFIALINLIKFLKKAKIKIIHANGSRVCLYAGIAGKILGIPIIWHVRETVQDILWYDLLLGLLSTKIICVSKSVQKKRLDRFGKSITKKIIIIYNGVDTSTFKKDISARCKVRNEWKLSNQILFGIAGNFVPLKGQDFFLKGFAEAKRRQSNLPAKVLLIGRLLDTAYYKFLTDLAKQMNIKKDIIFKNYLPNIQEIMAALDVFVLPSKREGFSRSLIEAMSCSLPVIATKISEIEEAIVDKKNGILVDFMDIDRMAAAIINLCNNESMRTGIGRTNRLLVNSNFTLISHARAIESLYLRIGEEKVLYLN